MKKKKKSQIDPDTATACLAIMLEKLKVIKLKAHRMNFYYTGSISNRHIRGLTTSSGSLFYTAEKYNP